MKVKSENIETNEVTSRKTLGDWLEFQYGEVRREMSLDSTPHHFQLKVTLLLNQS